MADGVGAAGTPPLDGPDRPTACVLCSHNCGLRVDVEGGRVVAVRADAANPLTRGYSCNKGYALPHYIEHAQRLTEPLRRRPDGSFEPVSWEVALAEIAARLNRILDRHPGRAVAIAGLGGQGNHASVPYSLAFLLGIGSPMAFNALAQEKTQHALVDRWMFRARPDAYLHADAERSRYILLLGSNPLLSNRGTNATEWLAGFPRRTDARLVVVDPRRTETARRAHQHLAIRPGTDASLLLCLAAVIVREGLVRREFIARRTTGFPELEAALRQVDVTAVAARTGLPAEVIRQVARDFAAAPGSCIYWDLGVEQAPFSTLVSYLIRVVLLLTGNVGVPGGNHFLQAFSPKTPFDDREPARTLVAGLPGIPMFGPAGWMPPAALPEEITTAHPDRIRALIVDGANPVVSYPDTGRQEEALRALELLVVIEPAMTETARLAHYVLPTGVGYEKWESSAFPKLYPEVGAQLRPPVVPPRGAALPEAEIYARLARAMGRVPRPPRWLRPLERASRDHGLHGPFVTALLGAAAARARDRDRALGLVIGWSHELMRGRFAADGLAATWLTCQAYALTRRDQVARVHPEAARLGSPFAVGQRLFELLLAHPEGVIVGRVDEHRNLEETVTHADGRVRLAPPPMLTELARLLATEPADDERYPFVLNGGMRTHANANTILRDPAWRRGKGPHCPVWMHPDDAARLGLARGDLARLESRRGAVTAPVQLDPGVRPGHLHVPNGFGLEYPDAAGALVQHGVRVNVLTDARDRDPFTGCPNHKFIRCRVVRADPPGAAVPPGAPQA